MMTIKNCLLGIVLLFFIACSKEATLDENYWETIEAGAYKFTEAKILSYSNGVFVSETPIEIGNSYVLMETSDFDGFFNQISFYGDWNLTFANRMPDAWNMENDSKRLTFSSVINDFTTPTATLTIDNVGKDSQTWHYVTGDAVNYNHHIYQVVRTVKP
jgi:hypothetical protein